MLAYDEDLEDQAQEKLAKQLRQWLFFVRIITCSLGGIMLASATYGMLWGLGQFVVAASILGVVISALMLVTSFLRNGQVVVANKNPSLAAELMVPLSLTWFATTLCLVNSAILGVPLMAALLIVVPAFGVIADLATSSQSPAEHMKHGEVQPLWRVACKHPVSSFMSSFFPAAPEMQPIDPDEIPRQSLSR